MRASTRYPGARRARAKSAPIDVRGLAPWLLGAAYGVIATLAVTAIAGAPPPLDALPFGFGDKIALVASGRSLGDATRLPFVPYFLGAFASIGTPALAALVIKNALFFALIGGALGALWRIAPRDRWLIGLIVFLITFPQLIRHGVNLVPEEGYLIALIAYAYAATLRPARDAGARALLGPALALAAIVLLKASALLVVPVLTIALALSARDRRAAAVAIAVPLVAVLALATLHAVNAGRFTPASSLAGYDLWKANNARTAEFFPERTLDALSAEVPTRRADESEWQWSARLTDAALAFNRSHPEAALALLKRRAYQVSISVDGETSPSDFGPARAPLKRAGIAWMVAFRAIQWLALATAVGFVIAVVLARSDHAARRRGADALVFLALTGAFVLPFLIAWGSERRLMPLVIPTAVFLWWAWRGPRPALVGRAPA